MTVARVYMIDRGGSSIQVSLLGSVCEPWDSRFTSGLQVSSLARHNPAGSRCVAESQRVEFSQGRVEINMILIFVCYTLNIKRKGAEQSTRKNLGYLTKAHSESIY